MPRRAARLDRDSRPAARVVLAFAGAFLAVLPSACNRAPADPAARGVEIAEARCACTRETAPRVARCVNEASRVLEDATRRSDAHGKQTLVTAYEDAFLRCPWDDPSYYR